MALAPAAAVTTATFVTVAAAAGAAAAARGSKGTADAVTAKLTHTRSASFNCIVSVFYNKLVLLVESCRKLAPQP